MKKSALLLLLLCSTPWALANDVSGVWELVSGEYIDAEGELIEYQSLNFQALKVVTASHFSFTSMRGDEFWASGSGTYELEDGKYTETLRYNSFGEEPGATFSFDARIEDEHWYKARWDGEKRVEYEVWRRVE